MAARRSFSLTTEVIPYWVQVDVEEFYEHGVWCSWYSGLILLHICVHGMHVLLSDGYERCTQRSGRCGFDRAADLRIADRAGRRQRHRGSPRGRPSQNMPAHIYIQGRAARARAVLAPASRVSFVSVPVFMLARRSIHSSHGESAGPCGMTSTLLMSNPHSSTRASRRSMRAGSAFCSRVRMYIQEPGPPLHVKYE